MAESETTRDVIAGWVGGAVGIVISNPLEVLKVRLQTNPSPNLDRPISLDSLLFSRSPSPLHHGQSSPATLALQYSIPPTSSLHTHSSYIQNPNHLTSPNTILSGLRGLWKKEGYRFLFAGAAAPIIGLAFIDSVFFATYGKCMNTFEQDRERPNDLRYVFTSGAITGGFCALLQTPIEVIKCRAQAEHLNHETGSKSGSFAIAKKIYRRDGFQGFYLGGLMTGLRDSLSSGIFFTSYALIRGGLRELYSQTTFALTESGGPLTTSASRSPEILVNMVAGGTSGMISALLPYPLDIIKTRLQVTKVTSSYQASSTHPSPSSPLISSTSSKPPTLPSKSCLSSSIIPITQQIYSEGKNRMLPTLHHTRFYRLFSIIIPVLDTIRKPPPPSSSSSPQSRLLSQRRRILKVSLKAAGVMGFFKGLKPTLLSSFVGSAITMGIFEFVFDFLGNPASSQLYSE
ncbi:hypothetical protein MJO28_002349 [Puccinia striiformis f. sp. tritici]|uniref:Uncharacterized protein n=1 Tax=Puccinia striiformis f. sp. tritici TaxID=168172 RepID=A0ACC0EW21_9BASI|nr:uncharacterized protein Pst134EA_032316 [Puccinia striiformis f. sp. tritici]KAH9440614.1 hypothetical protein Pst134EA_032316 [Puccinia striiformis f. sp. tritici]KAI7961860.1 hypothetical protein MJO28_002349 [Puccinia striiformis f. sp. tritici]KAI7966681.1 hypothetical protein MJO29_002429 [Puccinia striiformis f. sp. tritici]KAI9617945.1 hypothetical protein KEM48_006883 [Puccinia striiformis f. sp. tritici PST-130]